jgi:hypothetical protein
MFFLAFEYNPHIPFTADSAIKSFLSGGVGGICVVLVGHPLVRNVHCIILSCHAIRDPHFCSPFSCFHSLTLLMCVCSPFTTCAGSHQGSHANIRCWFGDCLGICRGHVYENLSNRRCEGTVPRRLGATHGRDAPLCHVLLGVRHGTTTNTVVGNRLVRY